MTFLPNPERLWERPAHAGTVDRSEVERRIGPISEPLRVLSGGVANTNVRVGSRRVLRIYRRDPLPMPVETALLRHPWKAFRVPAVLATGQDFVVLEHVQTAPTDPGPRQGTVVGRALAEIHRRAFPQAGFLGADLTVSTPFPDVADAFRTYVQSQWQEMAPPLVDEWQQPVMAVLERATDVLGRPQQSPVLLHGDFKASNLHWTTQDELLILDWEYAYAGPPLMDVGQLLRWDPPRPFIEAFAKSYREHGGELSGNWQQWARALDLVNLVGLLAGAGRESSRETDLVRRIRQVLSGLDDAGTL